MNNIVIYTTPTCGYCHHAKRFLAERGIRYTEHDVSQDRAAADEMVQLTGQMGVPVIRVGEEVIIGFDWPRLEQLLSAGGNSNALGAQLGLKVADAVKYSPYQGAYVGGVAVGSLGERAGLQTGDIIVNIDSTRVNNAADLQGLMSGVGPGTRFVIVFVRNEQAMQVQVAA